MCDVLRLYLTDMGWSVELRNDPDPSVPGVGDQVPDLLSSVDLVRRVGAISAELGERGKVEGETLGVCDVPVEYIHLGETQGVNNLGEQ